MSNNTTKIISLELILSRRLAHSKIKRFKLELKEVTQLLLGTNGSGKSSILYELSPLPADKANYYKGGKKIIVLQKGTDTFTLTSDFTKGNHHSFVMNGEDLNPGQTVTVQKELVKEHFGITVEIHEMLLGLENFTAMSPARRREWLTILCTVDYTYALKKYQLIQQRLRDVVGGLRIARERLVKETASCINEEDIQHLRERQNELSQEAQSMYMLRNANTPSVFAARNNVTTVQEAIDHLVSKFRSVRRVLKDKSFLAPSDYQESIDQLTYEISVIDGQYASLSEEYMSITSNGNQNVEEIDSSELIALKQRAIELAHKRDAILQERRTSFQIVDAERMAGTIDSIRETITHALTNIPHNEEKKLSAARFTEVSEQASALRARINMTEQNLSKQRHTLEHMEEMSRSKEVECPSCTHRFINGYNQQAHQHLMDAVRETDEKLMKLKDEYKKLEVEVDILTRYRDCYREYVQATRSSPALADVWGWANEKNLIDVAPRSILQTIHDVYEDTIVIKRASFLTEEIETLRRRVELAEYAQSEMYKAAKEKSEQLSNRISDVLNQKRWKETQLNKLRSDKRDLLTLQECREKIAQAMNSLEQNNNQLIDALKNEIIDSALANIQVELVDITNRINSADMQFGIVRDLQNQIAELELDEQAFKALADTLSPIDGLIAEGMLGFIRHYVSLMNAVVAKVWTYPMEVKDCSMEENTADLNYKFPIYLPEVDETVIDVSRGSSAMVEIVNLAFRIVATQCLGLDKGPLALDEFSKTFDEAHREAAIHVVQQLIEQLSYSQLFMISHYQSSYGAFYNAQITVVDKRNITVPSGRKYNEFTIIET